MTVRIATGPRGPILGTSIALLRERTERDFRGTLRVGMARRIRTLRNSVAFVACYGRVSGGTAKVHLVRADAGVRGIGRAEEIVRWRSPK